MDEQDLKILMLQDRLNRLIRTVLNYTEGFERPEDDGSFEGAAGYDGSIYKDGGTKIIQDNRKEVDLKMNVVLRKAEMARLYAREAKLLFKNGNLTIFVKNMEELKKLEGD